MSSLQAAWEDNFTVPQGVLERFVIMTVPRAATDSCRIVHWSGLKDKMVFVGHILTIIHYDFLGSRWDQVLLCRKQGILSCLISWLRVRHGKWLCLVQSTSPSDYLGQGLLQIRVWLVQGTHVPCRDLLIRYPLDHRRVIILRVCIDTRLLLPGLTSILLMLLLIWQLLSHHELTLRGLNRLSPCQLLLLVQVFLSNFSDVGR